MILFAVEPVTYSESTRAVKKLLHAADAVCPE
jgi:hypothetical protein